MNLKSNSRKFPKAFTLVEVLATVLLISIVIPVAMRGISLSTRMASHSKRQIQAVYLAKSKLAELIASQNWKNTSKSGNFGVDWLDYEWKLDTKEWQIDSVVQLDLRVSWDKVTRLEKRSVLLSTLVYDSE
jgi:prepilin-type N-terminal cleavage/methylation domain-containing protein